jgi:hypothetical protein
VNAAAVLSYGENRLSQVSLCAFHRLHNGWCSAAVTIQPAHLFESGSHCNNFAMGWIVWGSRNRGGGQDFPHPLQPGPGADLASYTLCTGSLSWGVKQLGHDIDPHPSSTKVKERVELYLSIPSRPSGQGMGWTLTLYFADYAATGCKLK